MTSRLFSVAALASLLTCGGTTPPPPAPPLPTGTATPVRWFSATTTDKTFNAADHFLAAIEMQISGEPFAQLLGRNLAGYDRYSRITDLYTDPSTGTTTVDPLGYSLAIESYEYSKLAMNMTSLESGAGLALQFGPLLNPDNVVLSPAYVLLRNRLQLFSRTSNAGGIKGAGLVVSPAPLNNPLNAYGWPGYWPVFAEFDAFQPDIMPASGATRGCTFVGGYVAARLGAQVVGDYECSYNSLNLANREQAVTKTLSPRTLGYATWKLGLWVINYWQSMHDALGGTITWVADADLPNVGVPANTVVGKRPDPNDPSGNTLIDGYPGVYLGDIPLEGFQGLTLLDEMDNKAAFILSRLVTRDGATLGGFASVKEAIDYDYSSPLAWWPAKVGVTELSATGPPPPNAWKYFPQPDALTIQAPESRLRDLAAMAGGFAELFALTDFNNADVGGQPSSRATFDGDPFPADNQQPDGEDSTHDRALALIKVAVINLDRMHFDPDHHVLVSTAGVSNGAVQRGSVVDTVDSAYTIVGLRTALRGISSSLTLYSNDTPDTVGVPTQLDGARLTGASAGFADRILQLIRAQADFVADQLVGPDGQVANSFDLSTGTADGSPTKIESEASAIRGLLDAYLATGDERYRQVAMRVYGDLERRFWMSDVRAFRTIAGESDTFTWTPIAFGPLTGALRQYWKLVGLRPGNERAAAELLEREQRLNKLVINGWDDANGDNRVQWPDECTGAGLQMGERALTGELSLPEDGPDRDHDCVKEISAVGLPAALAGQIVITRGQP
jgi:hypothetical protein